MGERPARPDAAARLQDNQLWRLRRNQQHLEAKDQGKTYYSTGRPCRRGHLSQRLVANKGCLECTRVRAKERLPEQLLSNAKQRAKKYNLPISITAQDIRAVWPVDNRCPIFKTEFFKDPKKVASPSLDRIRPELGYVPGNIAVISYAANTLKRDCSDPAIFRKLADYIEGH